MTSRFTCLVLFGSLALSACDDDLPAIDPASVTPESVAAHVAALPPAPAQDPAVVELGRLLFWDPVLSADQNVACASCHHPDFDYSDGLFASLGVGASGLGHARSGGARTPRNAPTVLNTVYNGITLAGEVDQNQAPMLWDNRVASLEAQARGPLLSALEMRGERVAEEDMIPLVLTRLRGIDDYRSQFEALYDDGATEANLLHAIATFERSLVAANSPFDRFMRGQREAMSEQQIVGLQRFVDLGCAACHSGPMFSNYQLHTLGAADHLQNPNGVDTGADERFAFRTPTLRNLPRTAPYLHGGTRDTLADVIAFYQDVAEGQSNHRQVSGDKIDPLGRALDGEVDDASAELVAFLRALDDPDFDRGVPARVPSGLPVGGGQPTR